MTLLLGSAIVAIAIGVAAYTIISQYQERVAIRSTLRRLEGIDVQNTRDQELLEPLRVRTVAPTLQRLIDLGRRFTPVGYVDTVRKKHVQSGVIDSAEVDRFLVKKVLGVAAVLPLAYVVFGLLGLGGLLGFALWAFLSLVVVMFPDVVLDRKVEERVFAIRIGLPDVLDLLVISVEAGLGFEQALDRTISSVPGPLTDEFSRMLGEVRAGSSRSDAMRAMEARLDVAEVRSFILAILQADTFGVSIGRVLRAQAEELRIKRRQLAQEEAQKAPVKMLIPMVFCIFPALFVIVLGPAVINIYENFAN